MSDQKNPHALAARDIRLNLQKLYGQNAGKGTSRHHQYVHKRRDYLRKNLTSDGVVKWAQTSRPKSFQQGTWDSFTEKVRKIQKDTSELSSTLVENIQKLSETEFEHSKEFKALCEEISNRTGHQTEFLAVGSEHAQHEKTTENSMLVFEPSRYHSVLVPRSSKIEILQEMLVEGTKDSVQWKSENNHGTLLTRSIQFYIPTSPDDDAQVVIRMGNRVSWEVLRRMGLLQSA